MRRRDYDVLIVGAGLFGATLANLLHEQGKRVLVVEKENEVGGIVRTNNVRGIEVHMFGAHIFKTSSKKVWDYITGIQPFIPFINSPITISKGEVFNLPFNMNTFAKLWKGVVTPQDAMVKIHSQIGAEDLPEKIVTLEDYAISKVGREVYERFIKGYTEKQWGKKCSELPKSVMRRIPIRYSYDNNYYDAEYQGVPKYGYTNLIYELLHGVDFMTNTDGKKFILDHRNIADHVVYTGMIDEFYGYMYGKLEYRSLRFEHDVKTSITNYQGNAVVNYADADILYTRSIEHCHFTKNYKSDTIVTYEYPEEYNGDNKPYYPVNTVKNDAMYNKYVRCAETDSIIFAGRLGSYKYTDMSDTILNAMQLSEQLL